MSLAGKLRELLALWREPVLRQPVLIIESDDWGPGPPEDAEALERVAEVLARHRDARGRCAVMTLGMVLAVPDTERMRQAQAGEYTAALLSAPQFEAIMRAIRRGMESGVFTPQLHGMEHYWPAALMNASRQSQDVRRWLIQTGVPRHEDLPPPLQSRWIDASDPPGRALAPDAVREAASREAKLFRKLFGVAASVAVPPTFVWTEAVEAAWCAAGVAVIVTPGRRYCGRAGDGKLVADGERLHNAQTSRAGATYIVRDEYFEPAFGHRAARALMAIAEKTSLGRPVLLETHRFNFTGMPSKREQAVAEIDALLALALARYPGLRFMSTEELATALRNGDPELVDTRFVARLRAWVRRVAGPRMMKWPNLAFQ